MNISDQIMTVNDVAEFFNVKPVTIRRQTEQGKLPGFKIGNQWRFRKNDIEKFIDEQIAQKMFATKAKKLWNEIAEELGQTGYTVKDVPELIRRVREQHNEHEVTNAD